MILLIGGRYQGKRDFAEKLPGSSEIRYFSEMYKDFDPEKDYPEDLIVIAEENSSGIVPSDRESLRFREEYNRALIKAADKAKEVYRVFCGIGMKIK